MTMEFNSDELDHVEANRAGQSRGGGGGVAPARSSPSGSTGTGAGAGARPGTAPGGTRTGTAPAGARPGTAPAGARPGSTVPAQPDQPRTGERTRVRPRRGASPSFGRRARNALLPATLVGLLLGLVVAAAGFALIDRKQPTYAATASLLVLPDQKARPDVVASLYDSLSSGQVVESFRAVMTSSGFTQSEYDALALSPRDRTGLVLDVHVVPSTALIDATVTARSPQVAERVADGLARKATTELVRTFAPFRITSVSSAAGTAEKSGPSSKTLGGVVALLAIVAVVVGQQAVLFLVGSRERSRSRQRNQRPPHDAASAGRTV